MYYTSSCSFYWYFFIYWFSDHYYTNHPYIVNHSEFGNSVINSTHFLYWGEKLTSLEDSSEVCFRVIEHTGRERERDRETERERCFGMFEIVGVMLSFFLTIQTSIIYTSPVLYFNLPASLEMAYLFIICLIQYAAICSNSIYCILFLRNRIC